MANGACKVVMASPRGQRRGQGDAPILNLALTGKRVDKFVAPGLYSTTIKTLSTYFGDWDVNVNSDLTCSEGDEIVYGTVSLSNWKVASPQATCPTCLPSVDCDFMIAAINDYLNEKYPTASWLE